MFWKKKKFQYPASVVFKKEPIYIDTQVLDGFEDLRQGKDRLVWVVTWETRIKIIGVVNEKECRTLSIYPNTKNGLVSAICYAGFLANTQMFVYEKIPKLRRYALSLWEFGRSNSIYTLQQEGN